MISINKISSNEVVLVFSENVSPEQAEEVFKDMLRSTSQKVIIDCSGLIHLGHQLLGKLYMFNMDLQISRRKLILSGCSDKIRNLLHLTRVDQDIEIVKESCRGLGDSRLS
jgi:anti-anti-sigma regulatory factor